MTVTRTRRPAAQAQAQAQAQTQQGVTPRKLSLGTAFETSNSDFFAGPVNEASGEYRNQQALLDLVGPPAEGFQWRIKAWVKEGRSKQRLEIILQEEPILQR